MLIYEIYFEPSQDPPFSKELQKVFLELANIENPLVDACYFQERISEDSYKQVHHSYSSAHHTFLVIDKRFLPYFEDILLRNEANKLDSVPSLNDFEIIYGSEIALSKADLK